MKFSSRFNLLIATSVSLLSFGMGLPSQAGYQSPAFDRGCARMSHGDWDGAIESFGEAIGFAQGSKEAYFKRGQCFYNLNNLDLAIQDFSHVLEMDANDADACLWRGTANAKANKKEAAVRDYLRAIRLQPSLAERYQEQGGAQVAMDGEPRQMNRGEVLNRGWGSPVEIVTNKRARRIGAPQNQGAIQAYEEAMAIYLGGGKNADSLPADGRGVVSDVSQGGSAGGKRKGGNNDVPPEKTDNPEKDSMLSQPQVQIEQLDAAIQQDPNNASYFFRRGRNYRRLGNFDKAVADFTEAIRLNPMIGRYYVARARLYHEHGDSVLAEADIKKAQSVDPAMPKRFRFDQGDETGQRQNKNFKDPIE